MPRSLRATLAAAMLGTLAGWACALTFPCDADEQCARDGAAGVCQASGYCSFPDESCDGGQRYGELAPGELAGTCVPVDAAGSGTDDATGTDPTPGAATVDHDTTEGLEGSTTGGGTVDPPETDSETDTQTETDTGIPICCHAGCEGTCDSGGCAHEPWGGPATDQEAIGVAVVGDWVVWSTGFGKSLELSNVLDGSAGQLAMVPANSFVTKIAGDDTHVYFLDYGGPTVKRASVPDGVIDLVTEVAGGIANWGGIAVGAEHVYFSMGNTGGLWRARKDLSDQGGAEQVADSAGPYDVALDQTAVYWVDTAQQQILSLAFDEIEMGGGTPRVVYEGMELRTLTVDATHVYFGDGSAVRRAVKDATNQGIETLASGQGAVWDIAVDDTHVYWSAETNGQLVRMALDGGSEPEVLAETALPWGLDLSCHAAFWAENGTQTLQRVYK